MICNILESESLPQSLSEVRAPEEGNYRNRGWTLASENQKRSYFVVTYST